MGTILAKVEDLNHSKTLLADGYKVL